MIGNIFSVEEHHKLRLDLFFSFQFLDFLAKKVISIHEYFIS